MKKKIGLLAVVITALIAAFGLSACDWFGGGDKDGDETETGSDTIIGTWAFGEKSSTDMITEVKVEAEKVTFTYKVSAGGGASQSVTCTAGTGVATSGVSVDKAKNTFEASDDDPDNREWVLSGTLNDDGMLVITGTLTLINGYVSSPVTVSQTAASYAAPAGGGATEGDMNLTGEIPFDLTENFSFTVNMKSTAQSQTHYSATFYAVRYEDEIFARYSYVTYATRADMTGNAPQLTITEERRFMDGVEERESLYSMEDGSVIFGDYWTTEHRTSTAIEYIEAFLCGDYVPDTPYEDGTPKNEYKIPDVLSKVISQKNAGVSSVAIARDGDYNMAFAGGVKKCDKYKGTAAVDGAETKVMEVMVWGNIVVKANAVGNSDTMQWAIMSDYNANVTQSDWDGIWI